MSIGVFLTKEVSSVTRPVSFMTTSRSINPSHSFDSVPLTTVDPQLQLGGYVDVEEPTNGGWQDEDVHRAPVGLIDPDRMLAAEQQRRKEEEERITAEQREEQEPDDEPPDDVGDETEGREPLPGQQVRQFGGSAALALPQERSQRLDTLNLEVQIRPQSLNGVVFYAASSDSRRPMRPKETPPFLHTIELNNGTMQYTFALGGEKHEVVLDKRPIPMDQWTTVRVLNDGRGRASIQVGSAHPTEHFYSAANVAPQPADAPSRVFLGGPDPSRAKYLPKTLSFIGSIGRLSMNGREVNVWTAAEGALGRAEEERVGQEDTLDQSENQCSRGPCRNGGTCRLNRWGGFECSCMLGYAGPLCQLPSTDGVCANGQRWCHRGVCTEGHHPGTGAMCLCPPGWEGKRCERQMETAAEEQLSGGGIRFDGEHSFLAIPDMDEGEGFSIELQLSPDRLASHSDEEQLIALLLGSQGREMSALGMQGDKFWAIQQESNESPSTKRFLTKKVKSKKTHHLRLEQTAPGQMRVLIEGREKGVLKSEIGTDGKGMVLLGGLPPRGIAFGGGAMDRSLAAMRPFSGCVEQLKVNGRPLGLADLQRHKYTAANLEGCEPRREPTTTTAEPTTPLVVVSVSEEPTLVAGEEERSDGGREMESVEAEEQRKDDDDEVWIPPPVVDASPDPLPEQTVRTTPFVVEPSPPEPTQEWTSTDVPTTDATTMVPAPPPVTTTPGPTIVVQPDSSELDGPFMGLCDWSTCGEHGTCEEVNETHVMCACRDYFVGQRCEEFRPIEYAAKFDGNAFVVFSSDEFPHLSSEREEVVEFKLRTRAKYGLIVWQGQQPLAEEPGEERGGEEEEGPLGEDYLSIGLLDGYLSFSFELGGGAAQLLSETPVDDGKTHTVRAIRRGRNGTLIVDGERPVRGRSSGILAMLNVEGHVFVGGVPDLHQMTAGLHTQNFVGCLAELRLNGEPIDLMASAIDGRNLRPCRSWRPNRMRKRRKWLRQMRRQRKASSLG